jgi:uncharacterized phage protein gp47/JayE
MAVNIQRRSYEEITKDAKNYLTNNSQIKNLTRTSTAKLLLDAVAFEQEAEYDYQRNNFLNTYLSTAKGGYLDEIGYLYNCNRLDSQRACDLSTTNFRFFIDPMYGQNIRKLLEEFYTVSEIQDILNLGYSTDGTNLVFPAGVRITNLNENVVYTTTSVTTMTRTSNECYAPVIAESAGDFYNIPSNVLVKHNLNTIPELRKIANLILCENKFGISNGTTFEEDENYRWRISNKATGTASGNETAIRLAAFSVPGVRTINIIPKAYGTGTFRVFVESINPIVTDGLLNAVSEAIKQVSAVGETVYVSHPNYIGIELQIQLKFASNANRNLLKESARTVIINYINNLQIGGTLVINEIIQRVMELSDQIEDMNIVLFGYGDYNKYDDSNENFTPLRVANQTATWTEKFYTNNRMCSICEFGSIT